MAGLIDEKATEEDKECWFFPTFREDRIPRLVDTIIKWEYEDLSRLRVAERVPQGDIIKLLGLQVTWLPGSSLPLIQLLVRFSQTSTLIPLLDQVTSPQHLLSLIGLGDDWMGLNVLGTAFVLKRLNLSRYLMKRFGKDRSYDLLGERGRFGRTAVHGAARWNNSVSDVLSLLNDETQNHHLLGIRDHKGRTVISYSINKGSEESFQSILRHHAGQQSKLLELAAITDSQGNTSFHYAAGQKTSNFLIDLIKATCSLDTGEQLTQVLSMRNVSGGKKKLAQFVKECHLDNERIYDWAFEWISNNRYLLFDFPSALIMYSTADRQDADKEAEALEKCFSDLGIKVESKDSFTKRELFEAIKNHQEMETSRNGQIVALMGHGMEGYISDSNDNQIALMEIERAMCPDSHKGAPKLLILQCCQAENSDSPQSAGSEKQLTSQPTSRSLSSDPKSRNLPRLAERLGLPTSYGPRYPDFCSLMSTGAKTYSERNTFIPFLTEAIRDAAVSDDIAQSMKAVKRRFPVNVPEQAPFCLDGFKFDFCIKGILPIYLKLTRAKKTAIVGPSSRKSSHSRDREEYA